MKAAAAILCLVFSVCANDAFALTGTVISVSDGDTITILDATKSSHKIRLAGTDAPEKAQPYGAAS